MYISLNKYILYALLFVFVHLPAKVLFILSLLSGLPGLGHICPVREGLEQTTDVLIFRPGSTDGQLLLTLDYTPEGTQTDVMKCGQSQTSYKT